MSRLVGGTPNAATIPHSFSARKEKVQIFFALVKSAQNGFGGLWMNIEDRVRKRIEQAQTTGPCLNLRQIADVVEVPYDRVWRFMTKESYRLAALDAEKILNAPLIIESDV